MIDWLDKTREDVFTYEMIDPFNLTAVRGYLDGVVNNSGSITYGYYTDTRVSGTLDTIESNYIDNSLIRIIHSVPKWGYQNNLGTFFVSNNHGAYNQAYKRSYDLVSMLCRVSDDALTNNFCIAAKSTGQAALKRLFSTFAISYVTNSPLNNKLYTQSVLYEVGSNALDTIMNIAIDSGLRLDVRGDGYVTVNNYEYPTTSNTPVFTFADYNGTINGDITVTNNPFDSVNRVIVTSDKNEKTVSGFADRASSSRVAYSKLGRRNTAVESITDLTPFTASTASTKAKSLLTTYEEDPTEYSFQGVYVPYLPGCNVIMSIRGNDKIVMMTNKTVHLGPGMITDYTLREI